MDPFWNNIYDDDKDKRYGTLFLAVILVSIFGVPLLFAIFEGFSDMCSGFKDFIGEYPVMNVYEVICLALEAVLLLVAIGLFGRRWMRIGRKIREHRLKYSNLSRDELLKARSKLKKNMNPVKFRAVERPAKRQGPTLRAPDTNLKY
jgi:hypothetical protein